jgi:hypothetical protein
LGECGKRRKVQVMMIKDNYLERKNIIVGFYNEGIYYYIRKIVSIK